MLESISCCRPCSRREVENEGRASSHSPDICAENKTCPNGLKEDACLHWDVSSLYFVMCFFVSFCFPHILTHPENPDYLGAFHAKPISLWVLPVPFALPFRFIFVEAFMSGSGLQALRIANFQATALGALIHTLDRWWWYHITIMTRFWGKEPTKDVDSEARRWRSTWALPWKCFIHRMTTLAATSLRVNLVSGMA